jgi:hypothetical protein
MTKLITTRTSVITAGLVCAALLTSTSSTLRSAAPKFLTDDPLQVEPSSQDASKVRFWDIDLVIDLTYNQFGKPGDPTPNVRAKDVNSVDEVPDGAWFVNRAGTRPLTVEEVITGPDKTLGPAEGTWTVTSAKSDGISPGFTIKDKTGQRWFIKFDPPGYTGMATGTEVAVTKLFWALGYHVPENHVAFMRRDRLVMGDGPKFTPPGRKSRPMKLSDIDWLLTKADREKDGTYRVLASRALEGRVLGGFRFHDTRPDDPNDVIPHEHRRALRGYGTFAAWLNHVDAKAINSMDTLVEENGHGIVRHNLLDFGSTLGSGGVTPREDWEGYEYLVQPRDVPKQMVSLGFAVAPWRRVPVYDHPSVGRLPIEGAKWDPDLWRPRVPNAAFLRARADDKFWAATKMAAISNEMIAAAVKAGQFPNAGAARELIKVIIDRRDAIVRKYLPGANPLVQPALSADGMLTFKNAAVEAKVAAAPASYHARWSRFDNATGQAAAFGQTSAAEPSLPAPAGLLSAAGDYLKVQVRAEAAANPSWSRPVDLYFRRSGGGWQLIGLERMPESGTPGSATKPAADTQPE